MVAEEDGLEDAERREGACDGPAPWHAQRLEAVADLLRKRAGPRILDLGCGEGKLLALLAAEPRFTELVGVDASARQLALADARLREPNRRQPGRVRLLQGSLMYRDSRLQGFDAAALVEVIEHLDPWRLATFERVVFEFARPRLVVVTTPNAGYNARFATLTADGFRHRDHRFEWGRQQFEHWTGQVAHRFGYRWEVAALGPADPVHGTPSQMAVFER